MPSAGEREWMSAGYCSVIVTRSVRNQRWINFRGLTTAQRFAENRLRIDLLVQRLAGAGMRVVPARDIRSAWKTDDKAGYWRRFGDLAD